MRKPITAVSLILLVLVLAMALLVVSDSRYTKAKTASNQALAAETNGFAAQSGSCGNTDIINCKYYTDSDFRESVSRADSLKSKTDFVSGGIVPHHLLACDLIAGFFKAVSASRPDVLVVLAPNHKRSGNAKISTGYWSWQTVFGKVDADSKLVTYLIKKKAAGTSLGLLEEDHSISALVPYIKYYMPSVKIVPVMLHGDYGLKESEKLGKDLAKQLEGRNGMVIASVDFSHYLPPEKAEIMDKATLEAIMSMNTRAIGRMGNDNLDCPPAIIALLSFMKSSNASKPEILEHSNSSTITGKWSSSTTSYFTIVY